MTFLLALLALSIVALVAALRSVFHDGPARPPRSHHVDLGSVPPASRASYEHAA